MDGAENGATRALLSARMTGVAKVNVNDSGFGRCL